MGPKNLFELGNVRIIRQILLGFEVDRTKMFARIRECASSYFISRPISYYPGLYSFNKLGWKQPKKAETIIRWLTSHPRNTVVLLDTGTPATSREVFELVSSMARALGL